jgi:hypothetical protein
MNGPQVDEAEQLRREALVRVGNGLRDHYADVLNEDIPNITYATRTAATYWRMLPRQRRFVSFCSELRASMKERRDWLSALSNVLLRAKNLSTRRSSC